MESALYSRSGFYPRRKSGEDFYTSPELSPAFSRILTKEIVSRLDSVSKAMPRSPLFIVEMGSGDGALARQILHSIRISRPDLHARLRYALVERVESLLLESVASLGEEGRVLGYSRLADLLPVCGVFLSNELVDAFPVHVLEKSGGRVGEIHVVEEAGGGLGARLGAPSAPELAREAEAAAEFLPEGGRHAVSLDAIRWIREAASKLRAGALITIDYGHRGGGPNPPRSYRRHAIGSDLLASPGEQDLTASVDFDALIEAGRVAGLVDVHYSTLGRFLLDRGVLDLIPRGSSAEEYSERNRVKTLFHPDGMGESFKVLIQEKAHARAESADEGPLAPSPWWRQ